MRRISWLWERLGYGAQQPAPCHKDTERCLRLLEAQREVLRAASLTESLQITLDAILLTVERYLPGRVLSVLFYSSADGKLRDGSAPSLPSSYRQDVDGLPAGPEVGSCGSAAWHGAPIIVEDIATDYRWQAFRQVAERYQLRACCSLPVFDENRAVVAILAAYSRQTGRPDGMEMSFLEAVTSVVGLVLERHRLRDGWTPGIPAASGRNARGISPELLAALAHEFRTPIHSLLSASALLGENRLSPLEASYLQIIRDCGEGLLRLSNDLVDLGRMEAGVFLVEAEPFRLRSMIEGAQRLMRVEAEAKGLALRCHVDDRVPDVLLGDGGRIQQVLLNLLGNAIKYTQQGEVRLVVRWSCERPIAPCDAEFVVHDTGPGVPKQDQVHLFEPFFRSPQSRRAASGAGLGLLISRRLVERMKGMIGFESVEGKGSTFWFRVPLTPLPPAGALPAPLSPAADPPAATIPANLPLSVLAVDDNRINQVLLERMLVRLGHQVTIANCASDALMRCRQSRFDVVLMDCQLPDQNGYEAAKALRQLGGIWERVPVLAVSAAITSEDRARALAAGMNGFLSKPLSLQDLADALAGCGDAGRHPAAR